MNRRGFLLQSSAAAAVLPGLAVAASPAPAATVRTALRRPARKSDRRFHLFVLAF